MVVLSSLQKQEAKEAFQLYDKDNDGKIAADEFGQVVRACGKNPTDKQVNEFLKVSIDDDGLVDFNALVKALESLVCKADNEDDVKDAFRVFDKDATGFIPLSELRYSLTNLGEKLTTQEVDSLIADADVDINGNINYADFVGMLRIFFCIFIVFYRQIDGWFCFEKVKKKV